MRPLRGSTGAVLATVSGLAYWAMVSAASGGIEPWDAPRFWTLVLPGALALGALLGALAPARAWAWGVIVMSAQIPVVAVVAAPGPLLAAGVLYVAVLSVPAALVSWLAAALRTRRRRVPG